MSCSAKEWKEGKNDRENGKKKETENEKEKLRIQTNRIYCCQTDYIVQSSHLQVNKIFYNRKSELRRSAMQYHFT